MKTVNVVLVGTGMYACGRGTDGYGTILPAIFQRKKEGGIGDIFIAGTTPEGIRAARKKAAELARRMGVNVRVRCFPEGSKADRKAYRKAIAAIPRPACAIVSVPDHLHTDIAAAAIRGGLHTLVVKPLASTMEEVRKLIAVQKKAGVYCAVEFHKRYDEANRMLRDAISNGSIGDPLYFVVEYSQRKSVPSERFRKWVDTTNVFQYLGIHYVDIIYFATGARPLRVSATGQEGWLRSKGVDAHDSVCAVIEWKMADGKEFVSHIITNWIDPESTSAMSDQKIKVIGTKGRFESDQKGRGIKIVTDKNGVSEPNPYFCVPYGREGGADYRGYGITSICRFLEDAGDVERGAVKVGVLERKRPTFRQSFIPTAVLEAANASLGRNGAWTRVKGI